MKKKLTIIGAGISGLSLAAFAKDEFDVTVLEASDTAGGLIQNSNEAGVVRDHAANGWLSNEPAVDELISLLSLEEKIITANTEEKTRWIVKNGKLFALGPQMLFHSLLPISTKFRLFAEPFISKAPADAEESLAEFAARRLGKGVIDDIFAPFASGIFACRPEELSVPAAFPKIWNMEQVHGSLIKAGFKQKRPENPTRLTSLRGGTSVLCQAIADQLEGRIHLKTPALSVKKHKELWTVQTPEQEFFSDYIAITCPASAQAKMLGTSFPKIAKKLDTIPYSSVTVVITEVAEDAFHSPPRGFGALMNRAEQKSGILGSLFTSRIFPSHQKEGVLSTRTILGGSIVPKMVEQSEQELQQLVLKHHERLFGPLQSPPIRFTVVKHRNAIPRYEKGHLAIQETISNFHQQHPTIRLSGNHLFGVAVKDCIRVSKEMVQNFLTHKGKMIHD